MKVYRSLSVFDLVEIMETFKLAPKFFDPKMADSTATKGFKTFWFGKKLMISCSVEIFVSANVKKADTEKSIMGFTYETYDNETHYAEIEEITVNKDVKINCNDIRIDTVLKKQYQKSWIENQDSWNHRYFWYDLTENSDFLRAKTNITRHCIKKTQEFKNFLDTLQVENLIYKNNTVRGLFEL